MGGGPPYAGIGLMAFGPASSGSGGGGPPYTSPLETQPTPIDAPSAIPPKTSAAREANDVSGRGASTARRSSPQKGQAPS